MALGELSCVSGLLKFVTPGFGRVWSYANLRHDGEFQVPLQVVLGVLSYQVLAEMKEMMRI